MACTLFAGAGAPASQALTDAAWRAAAIAWAHAHHGPKARPHGPKARPHGHDGKGHGAAKGGRSESKPKSEPPSNKAGARSGWNTSAVGHNRPVNAAWRHPAPPTKTWSRYMGTVSRSHLSDLGCVLGRAARAGAASQDALVVLDFGMPMHHKGRFGASVFDEGFRNTNEIAGAVEAYAAGYVRCSHGSDAHLELAAGTSNYGRDVTYKHGQLWGTMVNHVNEWLEEHWLAKRVHADGANDIEPGWAGPNRTRFWIHGYASTARSPYYFYGGAGGCPPYGYCVGDWTMEDIWYAAWGSGVALPLPEIYANTGANAEQWYQLSLYSYLRHGRRMEIAGVMTQIQSCRDSHDPCRGISNLPNAGWSQLWLTLNRDPRTAQPLQFLTDIAWKN